MQDPNGKSLVLSGESALPARRHPGYPGYPEVPPGPGDGDLAFGGLRDYVHALLRRNWFIAACTLLGILIGIATVVPRPLPYPSKVTVEVQGFNEGFMKLNEVDPQASSGMYGASAANILTQARILGSSTLRRRVLDKLERETIPSLPPAGTGLAGAFNRLRSALGLNPSEPARALREALQEAMNTAAPRAIPETRVVEIVCQSPHPEVAAEYLNTLVNEFIDMSVEARAKSAQRTSRWLARQLEEQKAKLEAAEQKLRGFVARSGVAGLTQEDSNNTLAQSTLVQLQAELSAIQADRIAKQSRYEMASARGVESLPELVANSSLLSQRGALAALQQQKAELLSILTPAHYKVQRIQAQINEAEAAMQEERAQILERIRNEYETAARREKLLSAAYESQSGALLAQAGKSTQYNLLRREVDSNRQLYNRMVQQVNQAGIASALPTNSLRVIDAATPASVPSCDHIYIAAGLGCVSGLLFGCVLAVLIQQLDRRLRAPGQVPGILQLPELGVIPSEAAAERRGMRARLSRRGLRACRPGAALELGLNGNHRRVELVTHEHKPSAIAESFRATLMSILFASEGRKNCVWSVTSPSPREGKSTVTSNLAIALAELKRRVVVVDGDLRKPRLHDVFDVPNTWGLSDLLQESNAIDQYPRDSLVRPSAIPNLFVLPSGPAVSVINALLCSDRLKQLLERLRREYDVVLIDTPPMLVLPDARIIGQAADAVILVFRAGATSLEDARSAGKRLADDGARILGAVLNDWQPAALGSSYRRYYSYYNSYYASGDGV